MADEAMPGKAQLCLLCFGGVVSCEAMCSHVETRGGVKVRCGRRCILRCQAERSGVDTRAHSCSFHANESIEDDI